MIRYELDEPSLKGNIEKLDSKWFSKAEERTQMFISKGRFEEKTSIWSVTKAAFMVL